MLTLLAFALTIVIIVGIHELGHYGAARMCGVRVIAFSIGFGTPLLKRIDKRGTEWRLCPIPLGGYVLMLMNPEEAKKMNEPPERSLEGIPRWQRAWVIFAGPLANFILSFVLYYFVAIAGEQSLLAKIGRVAPDSIAEDSGLASGDHIIAVDGRESIIWSRVVENIVYAIGDHDATIEVTGSNGINRQIVLPTGKPQGAQLLSQNDLLGNLGIVPDTSYVTLELSAVIDNTPASTAGLQAGDVVVAANDVVLEDWEQFVDIIHVSTNNEIEIVVARDGEIIDLVAIPMEREDGVRTGGYLGVVPRLDQEIYDQLLGYQSYGAFEAIGQAADRTVRGVVATIRFIGLMITRVMSPDSLSGPIAIAEQSATAAGLGIVVFSLMLAQLSLSLGLINLIPILPLDGGHLLRYAIEGITRKPVSPIILKFSVIIGICIILMLTVFAIYNDLN